MLPPRYSVRGYLQVVRMRTGRTLLVEGKGDRAIIARVVAELVKIGKVASNTVVVDTSEVIAAGDKDLTTLGAREKVEKLHAQATLAGIRLLALVDREFRWFDLSTHTIVDQLPNHRVVDETLFWTRGHSIENYFFCFDTFAEVIRHQFCECTDHGLADIVRTHWQSLLVGSAALSLSLYQFGLLDRMAGVAQADTWKIASDGKIDLDKQFLESAALSRGVKALEANSLAAACIEWAKALEQVPPAVLRWAIHGHVGWEVLWAGIARLSLSLGASSATVEELARGYGDQKRRSVASTWAGCVVTDSDESPTQLWAALGA